MTDFNQLDVSMRLFLTVALLASFSVQMLVVIGFIQFRRMKSAPLWGLILELAVLAQMVLSAFVQVKSWDSSTYGTAKNIGSSGSGIAGRIGSSGSGITGRIGSSGSGITGRIGSTGSGIAGRIGSSGSGITGRIGSTGSGIAGTAGSENTVLISLRWIIFAGLAVAGIVALIIKMKMQMASLRKWGQACFLLSPAAAVFFILPSMEERRPENFSFRMLLVTFFLLGRAASEAVFQHRKRRKYVVAGSVKEAIDTIPVGLLYYQKNGRILLLNSQMQKIMRTLSGRVYRNGNDFCADLRDEKKPAGKARERIGAQTAFRVGDRRWMFTLHENMTDRDPCSLLTAMDVTDEWTATKKLLEHTRALRKNNEDLRKLTIDLGKISRMQEIGRARSQLHETMGQQISLLLRTLQDGKEPDQKLIAALSQNFLKQMAQPVQIPPSQAIASLIETYRAVGISVRVTGRPASEEDAALAQVNILTEAVTNAVRHGYATEIKAEFSETGALEEQGTSAGEKAETEGNAGKNAGRCTESENSESAGRCAENGNSETSGAEGNAGKNAGRCTESENSESAEPGVNADESAEPGGNELTQKSTLPGNSWLLRISNNGITEMGPVHEGGGIAHMREIAAQMGGTFQYGVESVKSEFYIMISLPKETG